MSKLTASVDIYKSLSSPEKNGRNIKGILPSDKYEQYKGSAEGHGILVHSNDAVSEIEIALPMEEGAFFAFGIDDFLKTPARRLSRPSQFYIADIDFLFSEGAQLPENIKNYIDATQFASTLNNLADHSMLSSSKAIFLQGEKLELSLVYNADDLVPLEGLKQFIENFVKAEIHKEQKATIIKTVLIEMLKNNEINQLTLSCLIKRFSEFLERVNANYQLYVSEFSFEKIKSQVESEKFEFTLKLNTVLSSIQNQLLAVPVALILVSSQMEMTDGLSAKNFSIWIGAIIFSFFMSLLIRNQSGALSAIKVEIDSQWTNIQSKHKLVTERLKPHYEQLDDRQKSQRWFLRIISMIVALLMFISTILLLYNSQALELCLDVLKYGSLGGVSYLVLFPPFGLQSLRKKFSAY